MKNVLALLADVANGIFAVFIASYVCGVVSEWWYFIIGILLAMSPDIDALPELLRRGKVSASREHERDHRTFLHYPVVALGLAVLASTYFGYWGTMWLVAITLHLLNDMYGTGWGLPVFYPLSDTHYKFAARRANKLKNLLVESGEWNQVTSHDRQLRVMATWTKTELPAYIKQFGMDTWIEPYYLKFNYVVVVEYGLFATAVVLLVWHLL